MPSGAHADRRGPHRWRSLQLTRRGRLVAWISGAVALVLIAGGISAAVIYHHLDSNINTTDLADPDVSDQLGIRPADLSPGAKNILVIGSDSRAGTDGQYGKGFDTAQSDTLMLLHVSADRDWASVVSIPRDSWVPIPSCDMGEGETSAPHEFKINEAFALGGMHGDLTNAVTCTIKTVEQNTKLHIHHFLVVDFSGFKGMVNALGGVPVCTPEPIDDKKSGLTLPKGRSIVRDEDALAYVRARYSIGDGSDLNRIGRQQQFMASLANRAKAKLTDPKAIYDFLDSATKSLTADDELGHLSTLYGLADSVKSLPTKRLDFLTVPTYPREQEVPSDKANVLWKKPESEAIFRALRTDTSPADIGKPKPAPKPKQTVDPATISVQVLNGTTRDAFAADTARTLRRHGFDVSTTGNAERSDLDRTTIRYPAGKRDAARTLARQVPSAVLHEDSALGGDLVLELGADAATSGATTPGDADGQAPRPSPSVTARSADEDVCAE